MLQPQQCRLSFPCGKSTELNSSLLDCDGQASQVYFPSLEEHHPGVGFDRLGPHRLEA